jgi:hypothetical protein
MIVCARNERGTASTSVNYDSAQAEAGQVDGSGKPGWASSDDKAISLHFAPRIS